MNDKKYILDTKNETRSFLVHEEDLDDVRGILEENKIDVRKEEIVFAATILFPPIYNFVVDDSSEFSEITGLLDGLTLKYPKRKRI